MNLLVAAFVAIWLLLDAIFLVLVAQGSYRGPKVLFWATQGLVATLAVAAVTAPEPARSVAFWVLLALVNLSLAAVGYQRAPALAAVGALATVAALVLILAHSFASLPVIAVAGVICLVSALLPSRSGSSRNPAAQIPA